MEKHQSFDYCPDHPQVFLVGLMSCLVQYRYGRFIPLYVVGFHDFLPEYLVKWLEKFNRRLEPSVYGTFTGLEAQVMQLFHLAVEGKMILIFLQEYLRQKCRPRYPFVYRQQRHGCYLHSFSAEGWK